MATQWGWFGVGGIRDKDGMLCTLCKTLTKDRWKYFEWVRVGDHVESPAVLEDQSVPIWYDAKRFAAVFGMRPTDLYILNSQNPAAESHLQKVTKVGDYTVTAATKAPDSQDTTSATEEPASQGTTEKGKARRPAAKAGKVGWEKALKIAKEARQNESSQTSCIRRCDQKAFQKLQAYLQPEVLRPGEVAKCHGTDRDCKGKGCENCSLKLDSIVRVVARDVECDRDTSETAVYDFAKILVLFCALHCVMRVTECLFVSLAEIAQKGGEKLVTEVNLILRQYGVSFQMKEIGKRQKTSEAGEYDAQYNSISLPGNCAKKMSDAAPSIIALLFPPDVCEDDSLPLLPEDTTIDQPLTRSELCQQREWNKRLWYWWGKVVRMLYDSEPGPDHCTQFDLAISSLLVCLASFHSEDEARSLYLHTLASHARTMNRRWGSLAPFANQGAELKHTFGKRAFKRTGSGGCFGRKKQPKKTKETPEDAASAGVLSSPPPEPKPKATLYWPKTEPGTVEPKHTEEEVQSNRSKLRTVLVVFQQLLLSTFMALVYMCRRCDAYGECRHIATSKHGNFTPAKIKKQAALLAEQFAHIPDVFSAHDAKHGYLANNPDDLELEGDDDSEDEDDEGEVQVAGKRSRCLFENDQASEACDGA
jgi:hypothetical protein